MSFYNKIRKTAGRRFRRPKFAPALPIGEKLRRLGMPAMNAPEKVDEATFDEVPEVTDFQAGDASDIFGERLPPTFDTSYGYDAIPTREGWGVENALTLNDLAYRVRGRDGEGDVTPAEIANIRIEPAGDAAALGRLGQAGPSIIDKLLPLVAIGLSIRSLLKG